MYDSHGEPLVDIEHANLETQGNDIGVILETLDDDMNFTACSEDDISQYSSSRDSSSNNEDFGRGW